MDVVEGLLDALSDRHEPMVPENKDLKGQEAHGAGQGDRPCHCPPLPSITRYQIRWLLTLLLGPKFF